MIDLYVICGATATGKTAAAVSLAQKIGGEVISADSMQVYRYMDIGTATPTSEEMGGVAHHLISELSPDEPYSAAVFKRMAQSRIKEIKERGKTPIICGGTGFYINALLYDNDFAIEGDEHPRRAELMAYAAANGAEALHRRLEAIDGEAAALIHPNNIIKTARAIEFFLETGKKISEHNAGEKARPMAYNAKIYILEAERKALYARIDRRVDEMIGAGLARECEALLAMGYGESLTSLRAIGYKEMFPYIRGEVSLNEAAELIKLNSRHYAKRQQTWFRRQIEGERVEAGTRNQKPETRNQRQETGNKKKIDNVGARVPTSGEHSSPLQRKMD